MISNDVTVSLVVRLIARVQTADEVARFLTNAVEMANGEPGTIAWFALRTDERTFWIVDAFPSAGDRQAHLDGPIAAALMQNAERLLAEPPQILPAAVLASKLP
jgi:quinol monooxygenase YgiN